MGVSNSYSFLQIEFTDLTHNRTRCVAHAAVIKKPAYHSCWFDFYCWPSSAPISITLSFSYRRFFNFHLFTDTCKKKKGRRIIFDATRNKEEFPLCPVFIANLIEIVSVKRKGD